MTVLILRNHHPKSEVQQLSFNLKTGQFLTEDKKLITRDAIETQLKFTHPILTEKTLTQIKPDHYSYTYANDAEFYLALRYIYASLLQATNPNKCFFHIKPTEQFFTDTKSYRFFFSSHGKKVARQYLTLSQFNAMMTEIYAKTFQYCNQVFVDEKLSRRDLPPTMDADALYQESNDFQSSDHQASLEQYELRYINSKVGFGVFARKDIKKGTLIAQYCGKYMPHKIAYQNYSYQPGKENGFNLMLDAQLYGNISRFINHAPEPDTDTHENSYLCANLIAENHILYGNRRIMLIADRDIKQGEQLLSYYGEDYFSISENIYGMCKNGDVMDIKHRQIKDNYSQLKVYLSIFARYGNRRAQWSLFKRPLIVLIICIGLKCVLSL